MRQIVQEHIEASIETKRRLLEKCSEQIVESAEKIINAIKNGNKVLFFGNGGSASDAQHLAAEFVGRYEAERKGLAAIALTTDTSILTAVGNDYSYDSVFERQVEALGHKGDIAFGISTSGKSNNVNRAIEKAKDMGLETIGLTGKDGGQLNGLAQITIIVPSSRTAHIQESHITIGHLICRLVDEAVINSSQDVSAAA